MPEQKTVKKARSFNDLNRAAVGERLSSLKTKIYHDAVDDLVTTLTCDFKTWQLQWVAYHGEMGNTLTRLIDNFSKLQDLTKNGPESKVLSVNRDKE